MSRQLPKSTRTLSITNAHANNLKRISLDIEHDALTVITGRSGSGKSTLAFDTVHAEGHRRYIETFSPYTRQFFDKTQKPQVESMQNVRPSIAIEQRTRILNSRSTVGSITNINDYLKVLWSNLAKPYCPQCQIEIRSYGVADVLKFLRQRCAFEPKAVFAIVAAIPVVASRKSKSLKSQIKEELTKAALLGVTRFFDPQRLEIVDTDGTDIPALNSRGELLALLDRVGNGREVSSELKASIEQAYLVGQGRCLIVDLKSKVRSLATIVNAPGNLNRKAEPYRFWEFKNSFSCDATALNLPAAKPALFSYNHPLGACAQCKGFGNILAIDLKRCVPDERLSIDDGAIQCWSGAKAVWERSQLKKFCKAHDIATNIPWSKLSAEEKTVLFHTDTREYCGILPWFEWLERKVYKMHVRVFLARYRVQKECPSCHGSRVKAEVLAYKVEGRDLGEIWRTPVGKLVPWLEQIEKSLSSKQKLARQLQESFAAVINRLSHLVDLGVGYLTLDRQARTLSGGETQRVNLASALGSGLVSTQFVLDEPTVGLHSRDSDRLMRSVRELQEAGNTVLVVEHDPDCISAADQVIELGPQAGAYGGEVTYAGPLSKWDGLSLKNKIELQRDFSSKAALSIHKGALRNLKSINLSIPLGGFVVLSGVSGSGKSTLTDLIQSEYERFKLEEKNLSGNGEVKGFDKIGELLLIDQAPLAKNPRANVATYTGIWDTVRNQLASTEAAKVRKLSKSSFSFNVDGGRCPACSGAGYVREDMQFLSDVFIACEVCLGKRFQPAVLEVSYKGKNVDQLLRLSIAECREVFKDEKRVLESVELLSRLGLDYLTLGHPLSELSGGEAQRLKLVPFISEASGQRALLIFDEPTTGLHVNDVERLIELLRSLVDIGHSVLCVEHNLLLMAHSDWIIDLGPEGGDGGGEIVAQGTPHDFCSKKYESSYTANYLKGFVESAKRGEISKRSSTKANKVKSTTSAHDQIVIRGARVHNLKDIEVTVPHNKFVAITGVSGSGKSSIAKDIIYAEGQRRYLDCLSPYARQFIQELAKPDIDRIENIMPTVCVYQHTFQPGRLSTVGTVSEIYNYLRLLFSKVGVQYCPDHPKARISALSADEIVDELAKLKGSVRLLAPIIKLKKGSHKNLFERAIELEISEVRVDGRLAKPSSFDEGLTKSKVHSIEYVIAKFNPSIVDRTILVETTAQALALGAGTVVALSEDAELVFSADRTCPECKRGFYKPDPEDLSFHSKRGACLRCEGRGLDAKGAICNECFGSRLNPIGRNIRIGGSTIAELCALPAPKVEDFLKALNFDLRAEKLSQTILSELFFKIDALKRLGIGYLALNRDCETLSGGELQRLRLSSVMAAPLSGAMYIFDEPSVGLHPIDNDKVLAQLREIQRSGNSVLMIEHDARSIAASDYVIDVGPGGGKDGGEVVFSGKASKFFAEGYLNIESVMEPSVEYKEQRKRGVLKVRNGNCHNISNLNLDLPLHSLVVIAGVSGAGKSSLLHGIIQKTLADGKGDKKEKQLGVTTLTSSEEIERIVLVDQSPIGRTSRSTPASYLKIWDEIRKLYAALPEAKARGVTSSFFSYNSGKGRCPACQGLGRIKLQMSFLPEAQTVCEICGGNRFSVEADAYRYRDLSISQALNLTFAEAKDRFMAHRKISQAVSQACDLGLGYLTLGQSSATLSGGESQRIKLVSELSATRRGHSLYILDEPTTGLHRSDVAKLLAVLRVLIKRGASVIVIEHDEQVLSAADHIIELGPGAGSAGGQIVFEGSFDKLAHKKTAWGRVLSDTHEDFGFNKIDCSELLQKTVHS